MMAQITPAAGFWIGAGLVGFLWLITWFIRYFAEPSHELSYNNYLYSTKKAHRVIGHTGERISDGKWIGYMQSLWRCYKDRWEHKHRYFLLTVDELRPAAIRPLEPDKAKEFIALHADATTAGKLVHEWFDKQNVTDYTAPLWKM